MNKAQRAAHEAIVAADPECRSPLERRYKGLSLLPDDLAEPIITDHLHTRLKAEDFASSRSVPSVDMNTLERGTLWAVWQYDKHAEPESLCGPLPKLSAYLSAHIIRLGLDRSLIDAMNANPA